MSNRQKAFLSVFLSAVLGGGMGAVTKIGLAEIPPLSFAFLRFFIATIIISPYIFKYKRAVMKNLVQIAPLSLLASANIALFTIGIKMTTATIAGILYAGAPLLISFISYSLLQEKLVLKKIIGIFIGFTGVIVIVFLPIIESGKTFAGNLTGNLIIVTAVVCWSFYLAFSKKLHLDHSPFRIVSIFIIVTTVVLMPFFFMDLKTNYGWWENIGLNSLLAMFYVTILGTIITYVLTQHAIKHGGSIFASMIFYLQPVFAFLFAFILLGEKLTSGIIIGGGLALFGVFFVTKK